MQKLISGDCLVKLKELPENSVDSIVTDPPYELGFMGKSWDNTGIANNVEMWKECLRVLKPGGYLLSFGGTRTYHRMAVAIEDAGFEIRDMIEWVYGSGFPKSLNIGKAYDKKMGNERVDEGYNDNARTNKPDKDIYEAGIRGKEARLTKGNSPYEGWGTALKPSHEPIVMARKPLIGTVVENVIKYGTGGINIDGCRVELAENDNDLARKNKKDNGMFGVGNNNNNNAQILKDKGLPPVGRFPANLIHDGSDEVLAVFPNNTGANGTKSGKYKASNNINLGGGYVTETERDKGSAARFFYCAKASKSERNMGCEELEEKFAPKGNNVGRDMDNPKNHLGGMQSSVMKNNHPTVKPVALMEYLIKMVTPKGGTVLDPFMGSGSTGVACKNNGFGFIGIEKEADYLEIAKKRIGE